MQLNTDDPGEQEPRGHASPGESLAVASELARFLAEGRRVAIATIVKAKGSHPRAVGARMLVPDGTHPRFTIGGGALEASVIADCRKAMSGAGHGLHRYDLAESGDFAVGMTCGGSVEVFISVEDPPPRLVIFGAGHVGRSLAQASRLIALAVTVVDDREDWLDARAFPEGTALHRCARDYASDLPAVTSTDLVAVMTRCHATDIAVLGALSRLPSRPCYVGFMGSRRKVLRAFEKLEAAGADSSWLASVRAPVGLSVGAETPGEIAIAIAAEIVAVLRGSAVPR